MTAEKQMRLNKIISELNALVYESEDLEGLGATALDMALDYRADAWEGGGACPEPTPEELARIAAECGRNADKLNAINTATDKLIDEYISLTGVFPHLYELSGTYARSWHEKDIPEGQDGYSEYSVPM